MCLIPEPSPITPLFQLIHWRVFKVDTDCYFFAVRRAEQVWIKACVEVRIIVDVPAVDEHFIVKAEQRHRSANLVAQMSSDCIYLAQRPLDAYLLAPGGVTHAFSEACTYAIARYRAIG